MKYYVTTPIYYINDKPHIGHAYTSIAADVLARWHRQHGDETFFLSGVDVNSLKTIEAAEKSGMPIEEYVSRQAETWQNTWKSLKITNDDFVVTSSERHKTSVEAFFKLVQAKGDIYKGVYKGYYCAGCEAFVNASELVDGTKCPIHLKEAEVIEEENYFFSASKYRDVLLDHLEKNPDFVQPANRRNEITNYIKDHFADISISRPRKTAKIGIDFPGDPEQVVYVWFDALVNYLTGIGFGVDDDKFNQYWPADLHLVGKDIIKFHCALWPAMLMSAGLPLPKKVFAHGFFTLDGQKISKSLGNVIDPVELANKRGNDALRYFLLREIPFGGDGDFSFARFDDRYTSDLAKGLGNFAARVLKLGESVNCADYDGDGDPYYDSTFHKIEEIESDVMFNAVYAEVESCRPDKALEAIWASIAYGDKFIEQHKPWTLAKTDPTQHIQVMAVLLVHLRDIATCLYPFMPDVAEKIWTGLGLDRAELDTDGKREKYHGDKITKGEPLFPSLTDTHN